jgi:hypothetical protein
LPTKFSISLMNQIQDLYTNLTLILFEYFPTRMIKLCGNSAFATKNTDESNENANNIFEIAVDGQTFVLFKHLITFFATILLDKFFPFSCEGL